MCDTTLFLNTQYDRTVRYRKSISFTQSFCWRYITKWCHVLIHVLCALGVFVMKRKSYFPNISFFSLSSLERNGEGKGKTSEFNHKKVIPPRPEGRGCCQLPVACSYPKKGMGYRCATISFAVFYAYPRLHYFPTLSVLPHNPFSFFTTLQFHPYFKISLFCHTPTIPAFLHHPPLLMPFSLSAFNTLLCRSLQQPILILYHIASYCTMTKRKLWTLSYCWVRVKLIIPEQFKLRASSVAITWIMSPTRSLSISANRLGCDLTYIAKYTIISYHGEKKKEGS